MKSIITAFSLLLFSGFLFAQADTVYLTNPSFEGEPFEGGGAMNFRLPLGWIDCGFRGESPPDVHPVPHGQFEVSKPPKDGKTYIGMVTRDNQTWEKVGTKLKEPLKKGQCYKFHIYLARSELYRSHGRTAHTAKTKQNYVEPIVLKIWGGNEYCNPQELLAQTKSIRNARWLEYEFLIEPSATYDFLLFEAYYNEPLLLPYNGNILMDAASAFIPVDCDSIDNTDFKTGKLSEEQIAENRKRQEEEAKRAETEKKIKIKTTADFNKLVAMTKMVGESIKFEPKSAMLSTAATTIAEKEYVPETGLIEIFNLVKQNPKLSLLIAVKKNGRKKIQKSRIEKLNNLTQKSGLNNKAIIVRSYNELKWSYVWDIENEDLAFYIFDPKKK